MIGRPVSKGRLVMMFLALLALLIGMIIAFFLSDMHAIRTRMTNESRVVETRHGPIEFVSWGSGPAVLVVHGAGGGYDQGRLLPQTFGEERYRWISVSRFGYLRSALPPDPSTSAQAEAFADLLSALEIDSAAILAMSGGVPPALQFAQKFPERTKALILLSSAPFTPLKAEEQDLPIPAWLYQALFSSDFIFWSLIKLSPSSFDRIFDVGPEMRAEMSARELAFVDGLTAAFLPVTGRTAGLQNEVAAVDPKAVYELDKVTSPTLVVHAQDDGINPFVFGEYTAKNIAGSEFMELESGGHLLLGNIESVRERVISFLELHTMEPVR